MDKSGLYRAVRKVLPLILTAVLLAVVIYKFGFKDIFDQLRTASARNVAILSFTFYLFVFFSNSYIYFLIFRFLERPIGYGEFLSIRGATYLLTALNPGAGQGGMAYWISRKKSIPLKEVVSMMTILPVVDIMFLASILSISLAVNFISGRLLPAAYIKILCGVVAVLWLLLIFHFTFWKAKFAAGFLKKARQSPFVMAYTNMKTANYFMLFAVRLIVNMTGVFAFYFGLLFFNVTIPFWVFLVRFFPAFILQALPITVGMLGTSQGAWLLMYRDFAESSVLIAFSLTWVTVYNISRLIIGAFFFRQEARYYFEERK